MLGGLAHRTPLKKIANSRGNFYEFRQISREIFACVMRIYSNSARLTAPKISQISVGISPNSVKFSVGFLVGCVVELSRAFPCPLVFFQVLGLSWSSLGLSWSSLGLSRSLSGSFGILCFLGLSQAFSGVPWFSPILSLSVDFYGFW